MVGGRGNGGDGGGDVCAYVRGGRASEEREMEKEEKRSRNEPQKGSCGGKIQKNNNKWLGPRTRGWGCVAGCGAFDETYRFLAREDSHLRDVRLLLADIAAVVRVPLRLWTEMRTKRTRIKKGAKSTVRFHNRWWGEELRLGLTMRPQRGGGILRNHTDASGR